MLALKWFVYECDGLEECFGSLYEPVCLGLAVPVPCFPACWPAPVGWLDTLLCAYLGFLLRCATGKKGVVLTEKRGHA